MFSSQFLHKVFNCMHTFAAAAWGWLPVSLHLGADGVLGNLMGLWALSHVSSPLASSSNELSPQLLPGRSLYTPLAPLAFVAGTQGAGSPVIRLLKPMEPPIYESPRTTKNKGSVLITCCPSGLSVEGTEKSALLQDASWKGFDSILSQLLSRDFWL